MALQVAVSFAAASRCLAATYASGGNDPMVRDGTGTKNPI